MRLDKRIGTEFAQFQVQIVLALDQTVGDIPNWRARHWGKVVDRLAGDILTTKGSGAAMPIVAPAAAWGATVSGGILLIGGAAEAFGADWHS